MPKRLTSPTSELRDKIRTIKEADEVSPQEIETWGREKMRIAEAERLYRQLDGRPGVDALMKRLSPNKECRLSAIRNILLELHQEFKTRQLEAVGASS